MQVVAAALLLLAAPTVSSDTPADTDAPLEHASDADASAWGDAGWGGDEDPVQAPPPPDSEADPNTDPSARAQGEDHPDPSADDDAGWGAAGWGDASEGEAQPSPAEGPNPAPDAPTDSDEDWSAWDTSEGAGPSPTPAEDDGSESSKRKVKVGDVLAGSLRLTGSFLHFDDEPTIFPNGDDALALTVGRVLVEADAGKHVHFSFNGFGELARVPTGANAGNNFASAGSTASAYRTRYLAYQYWQDGSVAGQVGVEWASMRLRFDPVNIDIGRFPVTYTVSNGLSTNDFFAPFSATTVNTIYKPGVDAIRVSTGIGAVSSVDVVGVLGYNAPCQEDLGPLDPCADPDHRPDIPTWGRSAVLARAATVGAGFEWAALGGKVSERWVAGGSLQGDLGPVNLRAEFHVGIPDLDGDGHDSADKPIYGRVSGGPMMMFAWQNAMISAEYMFASDGASSSADYIERAGTGYSDDLPYLGQHYLTAAYAMEIIPILRFALTGFVNATDGSGLAGVSFVYSVADESDLILGVFVPWGRSPINLDPLSGPLDIGSEFGLAPLSAYLEARVFF